ncbi:helix-turn-helix domain-containing protein [Streptomyces sp. PA03-6a]|nr:helix-turn-helix domain-containing protein [Streptomyces sp. PA03-6a]
MYMVHRGAWTMSSPSQRNEDTVPAGQFLIRHFEAPPRFETLPGTTARMLYLPSAVARPLLKDRIVTGSADSAEMRLLLAHINMVHSTATNLGAAGVHAARSTLIELSKAVVKQQFDDVEPLLAPSLAQAAKDLADRHLANPELSVAMLAGELKVSVRTLHRAFAMTEESVATYIRNRRLEEARLALTAPSSPLSISEIAAYWHFNDSSHFIRSFKRRYGQTPASYARSTRPHNR